MICTPKLNVCLQCIWIDRYAQKSCSHGPTVMYRAGAKEVIALHSVTLFMYLLEETADQGKLVGRGQRANRPLFLWGGGGGVGWVMWWGHY